MSNDKTCGTSIAVLGSTGSVGTTALAVAERAKSKVVALAAGSNVEKILAQCARHKPSLVSLSDEKAGKRLADRVKAEGLSCKVAWGDAGTKMVAQSDAESVVAAICGAAGVGPTMAAVQAGKRVLLANKESLVTAGRHMIEAVKMHGAQLVPVDSEHGALLELLHYTCDRRDGIKRVWLTASGGPFHDKDIELNEVTPKMASSHPVWDMGMKISIDSATLMNKGLEVIEASLLFGIDASMIKVVVHPQGIVHAIVDFVDGGSVAHCAPPDMHHAIARALTWPAPHGLDHPSVDWCKLGTLLFKEPDLARFPCLRLAHEALETGGTAPAALNAANEVAVAAFCENERITFADIPSVVEGALANVNGSGTSLEEMIAADASARERAKTIVSRISR